MGYMGYMGLNRAVEGRIGLYKLRSKVAFRLMCGHREPKHRTKSVSPKPFQAEH